MSKTRMLIVSHEKRLWWFYGLISLIIGLYVLQVLSPLRLNTDACRLLSMSVSKVKMGEYLVNGAADQFPVGYPFIVKTLIHMDLQSSAFLVAFNLFCLFFGLLIWLALCKTQFSHREVMMISLLVLASWVIVKHVTIPLTEFAYFLFSIVTLFFLNSFFRAARIRKWVDWGFAILFAWIAFKMRTIGFALLLCSIVSIVFHPDYKKLISDSWENYRIFRSLGAVVCIILFIGYFWGLSWVENRISVEGGYLGTWLSMVQDNGLFYMLHQSIIHRLKEFGEVFINIPYGRISYLPWVFPFIGMLIWGIHLWGATLAWRILYFRPVVIYFALYALIMFFWPYYDSRFWIPIIPVSSVFMMLVINKLRSRFQIWLFE